MKITTIKRQVQTLLAKLGCPPIEDNSSEDTRDFVIDSPTGMRWKASEGHTCVAGWFKGWPKADAEGWAAILADVEAGLEPCDGTNGGQECEYCYPVPEEEIGR